jgi:DNA-binding NtrC family response regulator
MEAMPGRLSMPGLLVVDDEANVRYSLGKSLQSDSLDVFTASTGKQGIELVRKRQPSAVILDVRLTDMSGLDAFDRIREIDPRLPVIIITAFAATETAIEAMKRGAFEYLLKPVDFHQLREVVAKAIALGLLRHAPEECDQSGAVEVFAGDRIIGNSPAMQEIYKAIGRIAPLDVPVLIQGESGTGKELVARALFQHSRRNQEPFLTINCAAIPEALLESELFGHERGAFTGADRRRIGKFEQASGGTIFLDEIGEMAGTMQPKILRLLQEQHFERLGGNESIRTDVRIIAATNQNLEALVSDGHFRQDLFYRLKVMTIHLPPLRDRRDDLLLIVDHFIKTLNAPMGKQVTGATPETLRLLTTYAWPGNIRELQSTIKFALVKASGSLLTPDCLPENIRLGTNPAQGYRTPDGDPLNIGEFTTSLLQAGESDIYRKVCFEVDRVVMNIVLRHVKGSQAQASDLLSISRTTLRSKLRSLGIAVEKQLLTESDQAG